MRREARGSHSRSFNREITLEEYKFYNPLYKNEQLPLEYFSVYLHHIDSAGPSDALSSLGRTRVLYRRHLVSSSQNQKFLLIRIKVLVALKDNS